MLLRLGVGVGVEVVLDEGIVVVGEEWIKSSYCCCHCRTSGVVACVGLE
jgi:hypothetical protein